MSDQESLRDIAEQEVVEALDGIPLAEGLGDRVSAMVVQLMITAWMRGYSYAEGPK